MRMPLQSLGLIGLLGGVGGAINAFLCYAKLPVPVGNFVTFNWHIVPAGAAHGALLALISVAVAARLSKRKPSIRWWALPVVGWVAGWLSYIPLHLSITERFSVESVFRALIWPLGDGKLEILGLLRYPFEAFGLVGATYYVFLSFFDQIGRSLRVRHVMWGVISGCLGSLWFWTSYHWYFSLLHGTIWGSLVGFGVWKSQQIRKTS